MNWRWLLFDYIDPAIELSRSVRSQIRRDALRQIRSARSSLPMSARPSRLVSIATALIPATAMLLVLLPWFLLGMSLAITPAILLGQVVLSWFLLALLGRLSWRPTVIMMMRRRGIEVCFGCGYWLRGLDEATECCPECGRARDDMPRETKLPGQLSAASGVPD